jgi:UDP-N-acetylglucosamine acyltransferase
LKSGGVLPEIHPSAVVDSKADLAGDVTVGPLSIIEGNVRIGRGSRIHSHVFLADGTRIGKNCQIHHGAVLSTLPQDFKFDGEETALEIGDETVIREYCTLNRGTHDRGVTRVGKHCYLMTYTHVAHDCFLGDHVILANGVQLGGHATLEDWVGIGGLVPVHQFCRIGQHAFIGGGFRIVQDVPPFIMGAGEPLAYKGLNIIGLKRRGFTKEACSMLRQCYRIIYRSRLNRTQALNRIRDEIEPIPEVKALIEFIENCQRGLI